MYHWISITHSQKSRSNLDRGVEEVTTWLPLCHDDELSPDPDTDAEVGQSHQQHDDIGDEEDVLEALQPLGGRLKV